MTALLIVLYVFVCLFLILVVLLQQGKGADLAGAFGGGGSQTSFGPRGTANVMHRMTTGSFVLFVVLSMTLAILSGKRHGSVMESVTVATPTPVASQPAAEPALAAPAPSASESDDGGGPIEAPVESQTDAPANGE